MRRLYSVENGRERVVRREEVSGRQKGGLGLGLGFLRSPADAPVWEGMWTTQTSSWKAIRRRERGAGDTARRLACRSVWAWGGEEARDKKEQEAGVRLMAPTLVEAAGLFAASIRHRIAKDEVEGEGKEEGGREDGDGRALPVPDSPALWLTWGTASLGSRFKPPTRLPSRILCGAPVPKGYWNAGRGKEGLVREQELQLR